MKKLKILVSLVGLFFVFSFADSSAMESHVSNNDLFYNIFLERTKDLPIRYNEKTNELCFGLFENPDNLHVENLTQILSDYKIENLRDIENLLPEVLKILYSNYRENVIRKLFTKDNFKLRLENETIFIKFLKIEDYESFIEHFCEPVVKKPENFEFLSFISDFLFVAYKKMRNETTQSKAYTTYYFPFNILCKVAGGIDGDFINKIKERLIYCGVKHIGLEFNGEEEDIGRFYKFAYDKIINDRELGKCGTIFADNPHILAPCNVKINFTGYSDIMEIEEGIYLNVLKSVSLLDSYYYESNKYLKKITDNKNLFFDDYFQAVAGIILVYKKLFEEKKLEEPVNVKQQDEYVLDLLYDYIPQQEDEYGEELVEETHKYWEELVKETDKYWEDVIKKTKVVEIANNKGVEFSGDSQDLFKFYKLAHEKIYFFNKDVLNSLGIVEYLFIPEHVQDIKILYNGLQVSFKINYKKFYEKTHNSLMTSKNFCNSQYFPAAVRQIILAYVKNMKSSMLNKYCEAKQRKEYVISLCFENYLQEINERLKKRMEKIIMENLNGLNIIFDGSAIDLKRFYKMAFNKLLEEKSLFDEILFDDIVYKLFSPENVNNIRFIKDFKESFPSTYENLLVAFLFKNNFGNDDFFMFENKYFGLRLIKQIVLFYIKGVKQRSLEKSVENFNK